MCQFTPLTLSALCIQAEDGIRDGYWSRGLGDVYKRQTERPIQTCFRFGSECLFLTLRRTSNSLAHYAKGTPSPHQSGAPTACRSTVSGSISLSARSTFHLSLTVLVHYRSHGSI